MVPRGKTFRPESIGHCLEGHPFVWGEDDPTCDDAVWGHKTPVQSLNPELGPCGLAEEIPPLGPFDPMAPPRRRDRLVSYGVRVYDLIGSTQEWARDYFQPNGGESPCWAGGLGPRYEPVCAAPSSGRTIKGGLWADSAYTAGFRDARPPNEWNFAYGIRCVRRP